METHSPHARSLGTNHAVAISTLALAALFTVLTAVTVLAHDAVIGGVVRAGLRVAGYHLAYRSLAARLSGATITGVHVTNTAGEPVLDANRLEIDYRLRDVLPGGTHPFGLSAVRLYDPTLTVIHHRNGGYNITMPRRSAGATGAKGSAPMNIAVLVSNGTIVIDDRYRLYPASRRQRVDALNVDARFQPQAPSTYHVSLDVNEAGVRYPIAGNARIDPAKGYAMHHWTAAAVPIGPLVDYVINSSALHLESGMLHDLDVRYYGLLARNGALNYHMNGAASFERGKVYLGALAKPLRDVRGPILIDDDGFVFPHITATVNAVPVVATGSIYHFLSPSFRLAASGNGDLSKLVKLAAAAPPKPLRGRLGFGLLIEGPALTPTILASFASARVGYDTITLQSMSGRVAVQNGDVHVMNVATRYGPISARLDGYVHLGKQVATQIVASADTPARALPYGMQLAPGVPLHVLALLSGSGSNVDTQGFIAGASANESFHALFHMNRAGVGSVGPIAIARASGASLYGRIAIDRPHDAMVGYAALHRFPFASGPITQLPGLQVAALPQAGGVFDASIGFGRAGSQTFAAGTAHATDVTYNGMSVREVAANFSTDAGAVAARGHVRAALDGLPGASKLEAHGTVDAPFAIMSGRDNFMVAQIDRAAFTSASVEGIPLESASATLGLKGKTVRVYAARARVAGGTLVASGSFGDGGTLAISSSDLDAAALRRFNVPLQAGTVSAVATIGGSASRPSMDGGVVLSDGRYGGREVSGNADVAYRGGVMRVNAHSLIAGAVADLSGTVTAAGAAPSAYDLNAHVVGLDAHPFVQSLHGIASTAQASIDADAHIGGSGASPTVDGALSIPIGSLNGLAFQNARASVAGGLHGLSLRGGSVQVGTTHLGFSASASPGSEAIALRAPRANLADFNDFFDAADTLGGIGSIAVAASAGGNTLATQGDVSLRNFHYRRLPLGTTSAHWTHAGNTIHAQVDVAGAAGHVHAGGTVIVPATDPMRATLTRSTLDIAATATNADLRVLLPALGYGTPATGKLNGAASIHGRFPAIAASANASLDNGTIGRYTIEHFAIATREQGRRTTISSAVLQIPGASANASGSLGFGAGDPLALTATISVPDVHTVALQDLGKNIDLTGNLNSTIRVTGTRRAPLVDTRTEVQRLRYHGFIIPYAMAAVSYASSRLVLQPSTIDFVRGRLALGGMLPLHGAFASDPISLAMTADRIDLASFAPLLPSGSRLGGVLEGTTRVGGTLGNPQLGGGIALRGGSYSGPMETVPITGMTGDLSFAGHQATLQSLTAKVGGGSIAANGAVSVGDLRDLGNTLAFNLHLTATRAKINSPQYYRGQIDGDTTVVRAAGTRPVVSGTVALSDAMIPFTALYNPKASKTNAGPPLDLGFNLNLDVGNNVRVRGSNVDIGGMGQLALSGTLASPALAGQITATGGSIDFMHKFWLQSGAVAFDPSQGIMPTVSAVASTQITNPPTDVTLTVTGQVPNLKLDLSSDAGYSREQILGLLLDAQSFGAVPGIAAAPSGGFSVSGEALGVLNSEFTRELLSPLQGALGNALGMNLQLSTDLGANGFGFGINALENIGKKLTLTFSSSAMPPMRQSIGLQAHPNADSVWQFSAFSQPQSQPFTNQTVQLFQNTSNPALTATEPVSGTGGFEFSFQRHFK